MINKEFREKTTLLFASLRINYRLTQTDKLM
jgi:hypothetical protein